MKSNFICNDCKATLSLEECKFHPYLHCVIARRNPNTWRDIIKEYNIMVLKKYGKSD